MNHAFSALQKAVDGCGDTATTRTGRYSVSMVYREPHLSLTLYYVVTTKTGTARQQHVATYEGPKRWVGRGVSVCSGPFGYSPGEEVKRAIAAFKNALMALGYAIAEEAPL